MRDSTELAQGGAVDAVCTSCGFVVEGPLGGSVCARCLEQRAAQTATAPRFPLALLGGAVGALLGAGVWTAISVFTNFEVGYVAVLVGFLAGRGVKLGAGSVAGSVAGSAAGKGLQVAAAGFALFGLVAAKYFTFAHFFAQSLAEDGVQAGPFHPEILAVFPHALPEMLSLFDLLWVALAMTTAWKGPARP